MLTSDDHVIALERSHWTGECAGMFDRPGGHPEPSEVKSLKKFLNKGDDSPSQEDINLAVKREVATIGITSEFDRNSAEHA